MKFSDFAFFIYNNLKLGNFEKNHLSVHVNGDVNLAHHRIFEAIHFSALKNWPRQN